MDFLTRPTTAFDITKEQYIFFKLSYKLNTLEWIFGICLNIQKDFYKYFKTMKSVNTNKKK
uniref:Uncharacterized protein n=1 Tax=Physcomitrium patens TaxID=3218 RepID=A0A2K1KCB6_PHYPA|nr:hypothetical protein PHYPA_010617 [Physcomitrium patens]